MSTVDADHHRVDTLDSKRALFGRDLRRVVWNMPRERDDAVDHCNANSVCVDGRTVRQFVLDFLLQLTIRLHVHKRTESWDLSPGQLPAFAAVADAFR